MATGDKKEGSDNSLLSYMIRHERDESGKTSFFVYPPSAANKGKQEP